MCQAFEAESNWVMKMERDMPMCAKCRRERASFFWRRGLCATCDREFCKTARIAEEHYRLICRIEKRTETTEALQALWHPKVPLRGSTPARHEP